MKHGRTDNQREGIAARCRRDKFLVSGARYPSTPFPVGVWVSRGTEQPRQEKLHVR